MEKTHAFYEGYADKFLNASSKRSNNSLCKSHFHRTIEILYIIDGEMNAKINNEDYVAGKDDIIFVPNYYAHSYDNDKACDKYCFQVPTCIITQISTTYKNKTLSPLLQDKEFNKKLYEIISMPGFNDLPEGAKNGYALVVMSMLYDHYPLEDAQSNADIDVIVSILDYIDNNYCFEINLDGISREFGYNKYYFSKIFNNYINENLTNYINRVRLQHFMSKQQELPEASISSLAFDCGFNSLATFYRYFEKTYGTSPKEYFDEKTKKERIENVR